MKHGRIMEALNQLGWTQAELARQTGLYPATIGSIVNLTTRPSKTIALKVESALGKAGIYIGDILEEWGPGFRGFKKALVITQTKDVSTELLAMGERKLLEQSCDNTALFDLDIEGMQEGLSKLDERTRMCIESYYLEGIEKKEIGKIINVSGTRVKHIIERGLEQACEWMENKQEVY